MKRLPFYLFLLLLITCSKDSTEDNSEDSKEVIDASNGIPEKSPLSQYKTSHQNHEWNDGWYSHSDLIANGGTSDLQAYGSLTYFDYGDDGDWDVFVQIEEPAPKWFNTWIIENKGKLGGKTQWKKRDDVISEILPNGKRIPSGGRKTTQADIDGDGDTDIVMFIADDYAYWWEDYIGNTGDRGGNPGGGIYAFIYDESVNTYSPIEIEPYQAGTNHVFYHGGTLGDVNGDGLVDILAGTVEIKVWINQGNLNFQKQEINVYENNFICSSTLFDVNQDGFLDMIVSNSGPYQPNKPDGFRWNDVAEIYYGIPSYPYFDKSNPTILTVVGNGNYDCLIDVSITDFDNDGDYDIFTSSYGVDVYDNMSGLINYFENDSNKFTNKTEDIFEKGQNQSFQNNSGLIKTWDIDKDGDKELLIEASVSGNNHSQRGWNSFKLINGKLTRVLIR